MSLSWIWRCLHRELEAELLEVFKKALRTAGFIGGPAVEGFEREFAEFCDAKYCVGVNSGTDALRFALDGGWCRAGRHRPYRSAHIHRDDRSDLASRGTPGFRRRRRAHVHAGSGEASRRIWRRSACSIRPQASTSTGL